MGGDGEGVMGKESGVMVRERKMVNIPSSTHQYLRMCFTLSTTSWSIEGLSLCFIRTLERAP